MNGNGSGRGVVDVRGLRVAFQKNEVLRGLDLALAPGKVTVLLGTNGAGKSTLLRVLLGVLRPQAGTVRVFGGDPLRAHRAIVRRIGYVPDVPDAPGWMKPAELFAFLRPQYPKWNDALCRELCDRLAVPLRTKLSAQSRGQGMKTMLVAALASEPDLLLLDEPFAGLDPLVREEVLQGVLASLRDGERTVLCATHELEIAARIADDVAVLANGAIARHGPLAEVLGAGAEEPSRVPAGLHAVLAGVAAAADPAEVEPVEVNA